MLDNIRRWPQRSNDTGTVKLPERQRRIYTFLRENPVGVLASVDPDGAPHGVVIYYTINEQFEAFFLTRVETHKHHNLKLDNRVMLTVFEPHTQTTAQISGHAFEITDDYDINSIASAVLGESMRTGSSGMMPIIKLHAGPYTAYVIHPTEVRMAVYSRPDGNNYENLFESIESFELSPKPA